MTKFYDYLLLTLSQMANLGFFQTERVCQMTLFISKGQENTVGKGEITPLSNFFFSHSVFKRFVLQTCKNKGLFGKGLKYFQVTNKMWIK